MLRPFVLALALLASVPALAQPITPTLDLTAVRVEVTWVASSDEMDTLRRQYGRPSIDTVIRTRLTGFSVLGRRDGEYVCLLFVPRPRRVDDERTTAISHELLHCLLGNYHP